MSETLDGRIARDAGIAQVLGNEQEAWKARYHSAANLFLQQKSSGDTFIGEDLRVFAVKHGVGQPHHPNAWGGVAYGVLRMWMKALMVERDGMRPASAAAAHARCYPVYRVR